MPLLASKVIDRAHRTLYDKTKVRWPADELLDYANDAVNQLVLVRPDITSKTVIVELDDGTYQEVPVGGERLLRVTRNMVGAAIIDGAGDAIRPGDRAALDSELPSWHTDESDTIEHYMWDAASPKTYYVYPGSTVGSTNHVEIVYSGEPVEAANVGADLDLPSIWINPIYDWVLYRAYSKDAEYAGNPQRAEFHRQAFYNTLGISFKTGTAASTDPNRPPGELHG